MPWCLPRLASPALQLAYARQMPDDRPFTGIPYSAATLMRMRAISSSARLYSTGMILRNFGR